MKTVGGLPEWVEVELPIIKRRIIHAFTGHPRKDIEQYNSLFVQCRTCTALIFDYTVGE